VRRAETLKVFPGARNTLIDMAFNEMVKSSPRRPEGSSLLACSALIDG